MYAICSDCHKTKISGGAGITFYPRAPLIASYSLDIASKYNRLPISAKGNAV